VRLLTALLLATTLTPRAVADRARMADRVVLVQVLSSRTEALGGDVRKMVTHTEVLVGDVLKGPTGQRLTITQLGGKMGLWESHIPGDARFIPGETALVLLKCSPTPDQCGLVGLGEGKILIVGNDAFVFDLARNRFTRRPAVEVLDEVRTAVTIAAPQPITPRGVTR
jgi:hypothetical protein